MTRKSVAFAVAFFTVCVASVVACSVPVFRYALEQWQPDSFQVIVFHQGELTAEQKALVAKIEPVSLDAKYTANAVVRLIDLDQTDDPAILKLWEEQETTMLPWMLVKSPSKHGPPLTVVAQEFNAKNVGVLLDSPIRKKITGSLLKGDSAVWVLLECGDKTQDDAAFKTLQDELKRLEGVLKLPEIEEQDIQDGSITVDPDELKLKFSLVRVSRDDPNEKAFVEMLLTTEPDLREEEFQNQPMALPIFGRGRALYALIGKGILASTDEEVGTIEDACRFLTGACQCTVKAQNPGVDILTTVDWDSHIVPQLQSDTALPTLTGLSGFGEDEDPDGDEGKSQPDEEAAAGDGDGQQAAIAAADNASNEANANKSNEAVVSEEPAPSASVDSSPTPAEVAGGISFSMIIAATVGGLALLAFAGTMLMPRRS